MSIDILGREFLGTISTRDVVVVDVVRSLLNLKVVVLH